jgi:hypothetical protein
MPLRLAHWAAMLHESRVQAGAAPKASQPAAPMGNIRKSECVAVILMRLFLLGLLFTRLRAATQ